MYTSLLRTTHAVRENLFVLPDMSLVLIWGLRWNLDEIREGFAQSGFPPPNKTMVRERYLGKVLS
jgi:hypothetical protein